MKSIRSVHGRLILASGLAVGITLVISGYLYVKRQNVFMEQFHVEVFSYHSQAVMDRFSTHVTTGGMDSLRQILVRGAADPEISDIKLANSRGMIVMSAANEADGSFIDLALLDSVFRTDSLHVAREGHVLSVTAPIEGARRCAVCHRGPDDRLGYLEVDFQVEPHERDLAGLMNLLIGFSVILTVLLSLALYLLQYHFVRKPIGRLEQAIQGAMNGDLSVRVDVSGADEISRLTGSFNQLVSRLDTAQKELGGLHEREMQRAERLATAGELASGIAHEIKNPLAGIASTLQVKLDRTPEDAPDREILVEMAIQVRRIEKAVRDLLAYACPPQPEFKMGDLKDNITRCVSFVKPIANQQGTSIRTELGPDIPQFLIDATLLDQVIVNMLMNALQALREGGTIVVTADHRSQVDEVWICIQDDGPGLPEAIQDKVFKPFFTTKHKGSGLGLSICRKNVERHMGSIEVESSSESGTTFTIRLPVDVSFEELLKNGASR